MREGGRDITSGRDRGDERGRERDKEREGREIKRGRGIESV